MPIIVPGEGADKVTFGDAKFLQGIGEHEVGAGRHEDRCGQTVFVGQEAERVLLVFETMAYS